MPPPDSYRQLVPVAAVLLTIVIAITALPAWLPLALGNAAPSGPIRTLCTNPARTRLWGTAGDDEDMGTVFYYDDTVGLRQLGFLVYNIHGYFDGPSASNVLSSIAVSPDERLIAVGGADRIGAIHLATLN